MGQETHKWGKHNRRGKANTHLVLSTSTTLNTQTELVTEIWNACQGLVVYVKVEYSFAPRKHWCRIIVTREEEMRICFIFYAPLHAVPGPTPTRVKVFIPSVHLNSDIQNMSSSKLTHYSKEMWKNWGKTHPFVTPPSHNSQYCIA